MGWIFRGAWRWLRKKPAESGGAGARARRVQPARTLVLTQACWHFAPAWPWAYTLAQEEAPLSVTADGLTNWPSGSTARPPARPDRAVATSWTEAGAPGEAKGWLTLGGRRFTPVTTALTTREFRRLVERLGPLEPAARAAEIARWHGRRFAVLRARRRLAVALERTRGLAGMNTLQALGWAAVSAGLLGGFFNPELPEGEFAPWRHLDSSQAPWWVLTGWLVVTHFMTVGTAWGVHRKLYPQLKDERSNLVFSALLLPAQALRLRAAVMKPLGRELTPLAAALAAGTAATARGAGAATLRDLHHPVKTEGMPERVAELVDAAAVLARPAVERAVADAAAGGVDGVRPEELLAPPTGLGREVCAYCPRCGDGFVRADGVCPQGVRLRAVARE